MQNEHLQLSGCLTPLAGGDGGGFSGSGSTSVRLAEVDGEVDGDVEDVVEPCFLSPSIVVGGQEVDASPTKMG